MPPPIRLARALLLLALGIVLAAVAFSLDIDVEAGTIEPGEATADSSALARAYARDGGSDAATDVFVLLHDATAKGRTAGAALLERDLPARASNAEAAMNRSRRRVEAVTVTTAAGRACRRAILDFAARQRALYVALGAYVDSDLGSWTAADRYAVGSRALRRWWTEEAAACASLAPPSQQTKIRRALQGL